MSDLHLTPEVRVLMCLLNNRKVAEHLIHAICTGNYRVDDIIDSSCDYMVINNMPEWELHQYELFKRRLNDDSNKNDSSHLLTALSMLSDRYFEWSSKFNIPLLKLDNLSEFQILSLNMNVDLLRLFKISLNSMDDDRELPLKYRIFHLEKRFLNEFFERGFSEIHRHLNGSLSPYDMWVQALNRLNPFMKSVLSHSVEDKINKEDIYVLIPFLKTAKIIRCVFNKYVCYIKKGKYLDHDIFNKINEIACVLQRFLGHPYELISSVIVELDEIEKDIPFDCSIPLSMNKERRMLFKFMEHGLMSRVPSWLLLWFHFYIVVQNMFYYIVDYRYMFRGLGRFVESSKSPLREALDNIDTAMLKLESAYEGEFVKKMEVRVTTGDKKKSIVKRLKTIHRGAKVLSGFEVGVVFHMIKRKENPPFYKLRRQVRNNIQRLIDLINLYIRSYSKENMAYIGLFAGLDVAGNETDTPFDVFASYYRYFRKRVSLPSGFTVHAGESFRDIISGLRAIDEAIEFFELESGDRIGHAIVLGIEDYARFYRERIYIYMPLYEYMWNLVWLYDKLQHIGNHIDVIVLIEEKLKKLFKDVGLLNYLVHSSERPKGKYMFECMDIHDLIKIWKFLKKESILENDLPDIIESRKNAEKLAGEDAVALYKKLLSLYDEKLTGEPSLLLETTKFSPVDEFGDKFDEFIASLNTVRDYLIKKISEREIVVEINPTSNVFISGIPYSHHPVFYLNPPRDVEQSIPHIVVGSDDPGLFNTTLPMEFAHLYVAAKVNGYKDKDIVLWLEKMRKNGFKFSFVRNLT